ncbi:MAG TPA: hypothetical protein VMZ22_14235 [Acidimicrobiales bacterium]|nr:hypothetical protein [Acidimicrobiales bacterium]
MRRRAVVVVAALVAAAAVIAVIAAPTADPPPSSRLRALATRSNFRSAPRAAGALATIAARGIQEQRRCLEAESPTSVRCGTLGVVIAWAQVAAVDISDCTNPDVIETRNTLLALLDDLDAVTTQRRDTLPRVPPTPRCG